MKQVPPVPAWRVFPRTILGGLMLMIMPATTACHAQDPRKPFDLAITYNAHRSLKANSGQDFWMEGGSIELGVDIRRGWGLAADLTGLHAASIGASGIPLSLVTATFGPRYRWQGRRKISVYGQGLIGGAEAFQSLFPAASGTRSSAGSLATQLGGGVDCSLTPRLRLRLLDAGWLRTQLPNGGNDVQNSLRLGAGFAIRF